MLPPTTTASTTCSRGLSEEGSSLGNAYRPKATHAFLQHPDIGELVALAYQPARPLLQLRQKATTHTVRRRNSDKGHVLHCGRFPQATSRIMFRGDSEVGKHLTSPRSGTFSYLSLNFSRTTPILWVNISFAPPCVPWRNFACNWNTSTRSRGPLAGATFTAPGKARFPGAVK